jgi:hypothetical protein
VLQQPPLRALDLDDAAQIARVHEQLLRIAFAARDEHFRRRLVQLVHQRDQLEWTERLAQDGARACLACLLRADAASRQHHDRRRICRIRQLPAERQSVEPRQLHVEQHHRRPPESRDVARLLR